jgi:hypothetical protein
MDGGINTGAELISNFHVFWRIPTPHALVLEIRIEALGKGLVLARVADKAGVELEGLIEEGWQIVNEPVREATAPEKGQGEQPGFGECTIVEDARTFVVAGL